jgi:hypothetical protein
MRTLEKDPARRGTAAQLQADLERVMGSALVEEVLPERPRSRAWIWATAVLVLVAAALAVAWAAGAFDSNETAAVQITVPNVTGLTQSAARATLEQAGLRVGDVTSATNAAVPSGTVAVQDPAAGVRVAENTAVSLIISSGASPSSSPATTAAVPDVRGQARAAAEQEILGAGFAAVVAEAPSATVPSGTVISQAPLPGVVATLGSSVNIVVSTGPSPSPTAGP